MKMKITFKHVTNIMGTVDTGSQVSDFDVPVPHLSVEQVIHQGPAAVLLVPRTIRLPRAGATERISMP